MRRRDTREHAFDAACIFSLEFPVTQIDVVNDFGDLQQRGIIELKPGKKRLEGAAVALVRVLCLEHVEAELARLGPIAFRRDELQARLRIDESANEPRTGDPVHKDSFARDPRAVLHRSWSMPRTRELVGAGPLETIRYGLH